MERYATDNMPDWIAILSAVHVILGLIRRLFADVKAMRPLGKEVQRAMIFRSAVAIVFIVEAATIYYSFDSAFRYLGFISAFVFYFLP